MLRVGLHYRYRVLLLSDIQPYDFKDLVNPQRFELKPVIPNDVTVCSLALHKLYN
jgi:hypothetical protein